MKDNREIKNLKDLEKYLYLPAKDVPEHILQIFENYPDLLFEFEPFDKKFFYDSLFKRVTEVFPGEGLEMFRNFFAELDNQILETSKIFSDKKRNEKLTFIKDLLCKIKNTKPLFNEIIEIEIKEHRQYIDDYIKKIDKILKIPPPQKELIFTDLFKFPYNNKIEELKTILKTSGCIDDNNKWIGLTTDLKELATLYWLFRDKENILNPGKNTPQLKIFYKEFGLIAYTDKETPGDCSIRNITTHPGITSTYIEFERLFNNWISKV